MFIGVMCSIIGILLTIILVTPSSYALPGFGLASEGIAVKLLDSNLPNNVIQLFFKETRQSCYG